MWPQVINMMLGVWLTAAPGVLGYGRPASTNDHIVGPLVATFACTAIWEAMRSVRWINLPFGLWLLVAAWALNYPTSGQINNSVCGILIAVFSWLGGAVQQRFGGGWSVLAPRSRAR